jgi:ribose 5-phosphate isomerase
VNVAVSPKTFLTQESVGVGLGVTVRRVVKEIGAAGIGQDVGGIDDLPRLLPIGTRK